MSPPSLMGAPRDWGLAPTVALFGPPYPFSRFIAALAPLLDSSRNWSWLMILSFSAMLCSREFTIWDPRSYTWVYNWDWPTPGTCRGLKLAETLPWELSKALISYSPATNNWFTLTSSSFMASFYEVYVLYFLILNSWGELPVGSIWFYAILELRLEDLMDMIGSTALCCFTLLRTALGYRLLRLSRFLLGDMNYPFVVLLALSSMCPLYSLLKIGAYFLLLNWDTLDWFGINSP